MRWLLLLLVILNVLYFVWARQHFEDAVDSNPFTQAVKKDQGQSLQLVNESVDKSAVVREAKKTPDDAEVMLLGGFSDQEATQVLQQRLVSLDIKSIIHSVDSQVDIEYWVYLEPLPSRQAAVRKLKELQARNVDGYLITQGDLTNGISLGMFAREDSAQGVSERMVAVGYDSSIRAVERSERLYWVVIDQSSRRLIDQLLLKQLVEDFPSMKHLLMPREKINANKDS